MPNTFRASSVNAQPKWRRPDKQENINNYPFALASLIAGSAAVAIGLMISFVLIVTTWLLAAHSTESTVQVVRAAAVAWQAAHLVPVEIAGTPVGILPWGFLAIPIFVIWKLMHWALKSARPDSGRQFWLVALYFSLTYGILSLGISLLSSTEGLKTSFLQAIAHTTLIAAIVAITVLIDFAPSPTMLTDRLPKDFVAAIKPGLLAAGLLWIAAAIVTTTSLVLHFSEVKAVSGLMAPSAIDQFFLIFLCVGYLPTAITWTFSFLLGSGIHLGGGAIVSATTVSTGALPAFPLLSIMPSTVLPWTKYLVAVPIVVGVLIYFLITRESWHAEYDNLPQAIVHMIRVREILRIVFAVSVLSAITYLLTAFSSGPLGTGYLSFIGPNPNEAVIWTFKICGLAALLTLFIPRFILSLLFWWTHRPRTPKGEESVQID